MSNNNDNKPGNKLGKDSRHLGWFGRFFHDFLLIVMIAITFCVGTIILVGHWKLFMFMLSL